MALAFLASVARLAALGGVPVKTAPQPTLGEQVAELVAAMRAGGIGKMRLGELELDLTSAPVPLPSTEPAKVEDEDERAIRVAHERDRIQFASSGGRRVPLPYHGVRRAT